MSGKVALAMNLAARRAERSVSMLARHYWHQNPFGDRPLATSEQYKALWREAKAKTYPEIDDFESATGFAIDADWLHELALHTQIVIKKSDLCYQHGRVLYAALRKFAAENQRQILTILETGTARGFSALVMAKALADAKQHGKIITFDLLPHDTTMYWNCIDDCDGPRTRRELLAPWRELVESSIVFIENDSRAGLEMLGLDHIDFAYLDGGHAYKDVMLEFEFVQKRQQRGDMIVFDDYSSTIYPGLVRAVNEGCERWDYSKSVLRSDGDRAYVVSQKRR